MSLMDVTLGSNGCNFLLFIVAVIVAHCLIEPGSVLRDRISHPLLFVPSVEEVDILPLIVKLTCK